MSSDLPEKPTPVRKFDFLKNFSFLKALEGDDIFISYSRSDGSAYLTGLDAALSRKGFSCFTDKRGTDAGRLPPKTLYRKIRSCKTLVLLASPGAQARPENITPELKEFVEENGTSRIICVSFDRDVEPLPDFPQEWHEYVVGKAREREDPAQLKSGEPSQQIVDAVVRASDYMKSKDRLRKYRNRAVVVLLALVAASAGAAGLAWYQLRRAADATAAAEVAGERAREASRQAEESFIRAAGEQLKALTSTLGARLAGDEAERQKAVADLATKKAEEQTRRAVEAAQQARAATEQAKIARAEATQQQRLADARSVANRSEMELRRRRDEIARSTTLAVSSMNKSRAAGLPSVEADTALRASLALFPRLLDSQEIAKGDEPTDEVTDVALSPDARHFATIYKGEKLRVYDATAKALVKEVDCQCSKVALSAGAAYAAVFTQEGARLLDLKDGGSRPIVKASGADLIALSPGGRYLAFTNDLGEGEGAHSSVSVLDLKSGKIVKTIDRYQDTPGDLDDVPDADGAPVEKSAASCDTIEMYAQDLAFGPTGNLAAGGRYIVPQGARTIGRVVVWRLQLLPQGYDPLSAPPERDLAPSDFSDRELIPQDTEVAAVAPGTDQTFFATDAGVWKRPPGQSAYETVARLGYRLPQPHTARINKLAFGPDGRRITLFKEIEGVQADQENDEMVLETWDAAGHQELARTFQPDEVVRLSFRPRGEEVAAVSDPVTSGEVAPAPVDADGAQDKPAESDPEAERREVKAFSQTSDFIIHADEKTVVLWDVWAKQKTTLNLDGSLHEVDTAAVSPGGRFFALSGLDARGKKAFVVYSSRPGSGLGPWVIPQDKVHEVPDDRDEDEEDFKLQQLSLSEDGRRLAALYYYGETYARVWDVGSARDISPLCLKEHAAQVEKGCPAFVPDNILLSPDGRFLAESGDGQTVLLDLSKGRSAEMRRLLDDTAVSALGFSPDGRYLGVGSNDGILYVYETRRPADEIARLRHDGTVSAVAFSDDGRLVASASNARNNIDNAESYPLRVWHLRPEALLDEATTRLDALRKFGRM